MKKIQRILAWAGIVLLLGLYGSTMVFALSGSPNAAGMFKASIACTILVPVLMYANILVYKHLKNRSEEEMREPGDDEGEKND